MMSGKGWIGVDLDGTLLTYDRWVGWNVFGEPIEPMVRRVRQWIAEGKEVRIMTARVRVFNPKTDDLRDRSCRVTGERFSNRMMINAVQDAVEPHVGKRLFVTCVKDVDMIELWDDRAVQVVPNTGRTLAEEHVAELSALRGKAFQSTIVPICECEMPTATICDDKGCRCTSCGKMARPTMHEHPSHNVSDSFYACYGCGLPAGHADLMKPCPTPDDVGKMRMERR